MVNNSSEFVSLGFQQHPWCFMTRYPFCMNDMTVTGTNNTSTVSLDLKYCYINWTTRLLRRYLEGAHCGFS
jgi:hypothetical protein